MDSNSTTETEYDLSVKGNGTNKTIETGWDLSVVRPDTKETIETRWDLSVAMPDTNETIETRWDLSVARPDTNETIETRYDLSVKGQGTNKTLQTEYDLFVKATSTNKGLETGYDLSVKGHDSYLFYPIHIVAISCIVASLICAFLVFVFTIRKKKPFFKRLKCERFVVYLSICDGCFNIFHLMDHMQYIITKSHPNPVGICSFYAFMMCVFVMAQMLCVNAIAINTFRMAYFGHNPDYGERDYQLLIYMFGVPIFMAIVFASLGQFGPNGYFCGFDGVKGGIILLLFTTIPTGMILAVNSVLYILTWSKLHQEAKRLRSRLGKDTAAVRGSHNAAKSMSILVGLFFIQWTPSLMFGVWDIVRQSPAVVVLIVVLTSNAGGVLNGMAYVCIHKNKGKHKPNPKPSGQSVTTKRSTLSTSNNNKNRIQKKHLYKVHAEGKSNKTSIEVHHHECTQHGTVTNDASTQDILDG